MSERPQRKFLDPVDESLKCNVCGEVFHDPHIIDCGHTFCFFCISLLRTAQKSCVDCQKILEPIHIIPNKNLSNIIDRLRTKCAFDGCNWTGLCFELKAHRRVCEWRAKKDHKQIDPCYVIDLEAPKIEENNPVDQKKIAQKFVNTYKKLQYSYHPLQQISDSRGFHNKQTMFPQSYPPPILIGGQIRQQRIMQDVLVKTQINLSNVAINSRNKINQPSHERYFTLPSYQMDQESSWSSQEEDVSMVDESEQIQDSNRSSNLTDRKIVERQIVFLSESSDLYQPEEKQVRRSFEREPEVANQNVSLKFNSMTTRSKGRLGENSSSVQISNYQLPTLQAKKSTVSGSANQPEDQKEPGSQHDPEK